MARPVDGEVLRNVGRCAAGPRPDRGQLPVVVIETALGAKPLTVGDTGPEIQEGLQLSPNPLGTII